MKGSVSAVVFVASALGSLMGCSGSSSGSSPSDASASAEQCSVGHYYSIRVTEVPNSRSGCNADFQASISLADGGLELLSAGLSFECKVTESTTSCPAHVKATCTSRYGNTGTVDLAVDRSNNGNVDVTDVHPDLTCEFSSSASGPRDH